MVAGSGTSERGLAMSFTNLNTATNDLRNSGGFIGRIADRLGVIALLAMGLAMGGVTAFAGI